MEEEKKQTNNETINEQNEKIEEQKEDKILRPTTSYEELLRNKNNNNSKELVAKVEQYNFNNGFKNSKQVNETLIEEKIVTPKPLENNNEKIDIKPPRKKNKYLPIILLLILILIGTGTYFYLNFYNKPSKVNEPPKKEEEEKVLEKQNKTTCRLAIKQEAQKQNTIIEYVYYDKEDKLQAYEQKVTYEYLEEVPKNIFDECSLTNESYKGYEGYSNTCFKNDELSYTFKTAVDLKKLEEKTLTFTNNSVTITSTLDDDTSSFKKTYEDSNYECVTEEVVIDEDEEDKENKEEIKEAEETEMPNEVIDE